MISIKQTAKRNRNKSYLVGQTDFIAQIEKLWFSEKCQEYWKAEGMTFEMWIDFKKEQIMREINNLYKQKTQQ